MKAATIATCSYFVPSYNAHTEKQVWFFRARNRYLTAKGCQRLLSKGCPETEGEPKPHYTVTRVEHAAFGN